MTKRSSNAAVKLCAVACGTIAIAINCLFQAASAEITETIVECTDGVTHTLNYDDNTSGCAIDDPTDEDRFLFSGEAGTSIRISVDPSGDLDPRIEVRDQGNVVLSDTSCSDCSNTIDLDLVATEFYLIAVSDSGLNNTGEYSINLSCLYGECPGATFPEIHYDTPVEESLGPASDMDIYSFAGAAGTSVRINVTGHSQDLDSRIEVRGPDGVVLADEYCAGQYYYHYCSVAVDMDLEEAGEYLIGVSDFGLNNPGNYSISLNCLYGECPEATFPEIHYDTPVEESLGPASDMDIYSFAGAAGTSVRINVTGHTQDLDSRIEVRGPDGVVLADDYCAGQYYYHYCSVAVDMDLEEAGEYLIGVSDFGLNNPGNYSISLNCLYGECPIAIFGGIQYDEPFVDAFTIASDMDAFAFEGAAGTSIRINVTGQSQDLDSRIEVRGPDGVLLADTFCAGQYYYHYCSVSVDLQLTLDGEYFVTLSDAGIDNPGGYSMSLNCLYGDCPSARFLEIDYDSPVEDTLSPAADMDVFSFSGIAGTSIRVNVTGKTQGLDSRIEIRGPDGVLLADEHCAGQYDYHTCSVAAEIDLEATGQYLIAVSDFGLNEPGDYSISLNCVFGFSCLVISPALDFEVSGLQGSFAGESTDYMLTNNGLIPIDYEITVTEDFVSLSETSGTLLGEESATISVTLNANADALAEGFYSAEVAFTNVTNGQGNDSRLVELDVKCAGSLQLTPAANLSFSGRPGGPFSPTSSTFELTNPITQIGGTICASDVSFAIESPDDFLSISPSSGIVPAGGSVQVTVSPNSNAFALTEGGYESQLSFTDTINHLGDTERAVSLTVESPTQAALNGAATVIDLGQFNNGNGPKIAVLREGSILAEIRDGVSGALLRNLEFFDDNYTPITAVGLPDADGDGSAELAVLATRNSDSRMVVEIRNVTGPESPRLVWFAAGHAPIGMTSLVDDADCNGTPELAVLSTRISDGRGTVEIKNAFGETNPNTIWSASGYTPIDVEIVPDSDDNGVPEIAVLSTRDQDGRIVVNIKNASGPTDPNAVWFMAGNTPIDLAIVPDKDANGIPEVAVLSSRQSDGRNVVEVKNAQGPTAPNAVWFFPGATAMSLASVDDADQNGIPEVAVLSTRDSDGRNLVEVKNANGPTSPQTLWYTPGYTAWGLGVLDDADGDGTDEAAVLLTRDFDGRILVQSRNTAGSLSPRDYWFSP